MEKVNFKEKFRNLIYRIKYGFIKNIFTIILGVCTIIPIIVGLNIWEGSAIIGLAVIPTLYRLICNIILWIIKKAGKPENTGLFNSISRISVLIGFFILACVSVALGKEEMGFIEIILLSVCLAYFDKVIFIIIAAFFGVAFNEATLGSSTSTDSVGSLIGNTKITSDRGNGRKIYQDASGKIIGTSRYDEKTGRTVYWNENNQCIGMSEKDKYDNETYFDSKLKYSGRSEKGSNGYTTYYDEKLNFKGTSRNNGNGSESYFNK